jgi:hypothetical protein
MPAEFSRCETVCATAQKVMGFAFSAAAAGASNFGSKARSFFDLEFEPKNPLTQSSSI